MQTAVGCSPLTTPIIIFRTQEPELKLMSCICRVLSLTTPKIRMLEKYNIFVKFVVLIRGLVYVIKVEKKEGKIKRKIKKVLPSQKA